MYVQTPISQKNVMFFSECSIVGFVVVVLCLCVYV